jgi:hypothetical protein
MDGPLGAMNGGRESGERLARICGSLLSGWMTDPVVWAVFSGRLMTPQSAINQTKAQEEMPVKLRPYSISVPFWVQLARCYDRLPLSRVVYIAHRGAARPLRRSVGLCRAIPSGRKVERLIRHPPALI